MNLKSKNTLLFLLVIYFYGCTKSPDNSLPLASMNKLPSGSTISTQKLSGVGNCSFWHHDSKLFSFGDFQACNYNHSKDKAKIAQCMTKYGWTKYYARGRKDCNRNHPKFSFGTKSRCLDSAKIDGKIDHHSLNTCLREAGPNKEEPCTVLVHPQLTDPTADYEACFHNNGKNNAAADVCMVEFGWTKETSLAACSKKPPRIYLSNDKQKCLKWSTIDGNVRHYLMNECLRMIRYPTISN